MVIRHDGSLLSSKPVHFHLTLISMVKDTYIEWQPVIEQCLLCKSGDWKTLQRVCRVNYRHVLWEMPLRIEWTRWYSHNAKVCLLLYDHSKLKPICFLDHVHILKIYRSSSQWIKSMSSCYNLFDKWKFIVIRVVTALFERLISLYE